MKVVWSKEILINEKWHINNITINNIVITIISVHLDAYLGPCKAFMMVFFSQKRSIIDVWQGPKYAYDITLTWICSVQYSTP